jgi:hypothetical protein
VKIELVKKLTPKERFIYWIKERHEIYLRRKAGQPKPWTDDLVLQTVFFTNPYRENDKTTVWFREHFRDEYKDDPRILFATICFRWFNLISTGEVLKESGLLLNWNEAKAVRTLSKIRDRKEAVFTGAYMIKSPEGLAKIEGISGCITNVWNDRKRLQQFSEDATTQEVVCDELDKYPFLGGFMGYEIVTDLTHTYYLRKAKDRMTWCNIGPGSSRGLMRMAGIVPPNNRFGKQKRHNKVPPDWKARMIKLLSYTENQLGNYLPHTDMRLIEHSICEWDKYERALWGQGRLKRMYDGG